jgi:hypothetical protein
MRQVGSSTLHFLEGQPLAEGTRLQVQLADGSWLEGVYSWSGVVARWPGLRIELGGPIPEGWPRRPMAVMALPPQAVVRRPVPRDMTPSPPIAHAGNGR